MTIAATARGVEDRPAEPAAPLVPVGRARWSGAIAAGVALGVGELVAGLGSTITGTPQSLVASVGAEFIDRAPGGVERPAIELFGTSDKAVLLVGVVVVCLLIGAALGALARTRPGWATAGFVGFGVVGVAAAMVDPQASISVAVVAAAAAVACGVATLRLLLRTALVGTPLPPPPGRRVEYPTDPAATRRGFFGWAGAAAAFAAAAGAGGAALSRPSAAEQARRDLVLPPTTSGSGAGPVTVSGDIGVPGLAPYITPNDDFYRIDTALVVPQIEPSDWSLRVDGMVDSPFELTFDELLAMPQVEETVTLACVSNGVGGDLVGNAVWQGVPLAAVLERAGVQPGATQLVGTSADGWTCGFPTELALDGRPALLAIGMNGEPLPVRHGFPVRVVVAGLYGYVSATKWVSKLTLTTWEDFDGYWIPKGWSKTGPVKTQSRIDVPRSGRRLTAGTTRIAGVAWAPTRGISRVEVRIDGGEWRRARLGDAVSDNTWVQWVVDWDATEGEHEIVVRATDGDGETQTEERSRPDPDGATGWPSRFLRVDPA